MASIEKCYIRLGKAIAKTRVEKGIKQATLAKKLKISRPSLANIEAGRQRIHLHHILAVKRQFMWSNDYVIDIAEGSKNAGSSEN